MKDRKISRREFLKASLGTLAGAALPASLSRLSSQQSPLGTGTIPQAQPPNVIYIMADQLRACSVGCYGNSEISTPHIDQLASEGALFQNAVTTSPLCTPHRACLMTGRYPTITGLADNNIKLPEYELSIAETLGENGYQTGYIGKWHLNGPTPAPSEDPGWVATEDRQGFQYWSAFNYAHMYYGGKYYENDDPTLHLIPEGEYEPDFQTAKAISFIQDNYDRKFCLFLSIGTPHRQSKACPTDLPPGGDYMFPYDPGSLTLRPNINYFDLDYAHQEYADYYGIVSNFDWNVGRIMHTLDSLGLKDNTILAVSSDHGDFLGSHYGIYGNFRGKEVIEAEVLDIPFILRYPARITPHVVNDVFTSTDIMPTLSGLCQLLVPNGVMGRDFSPLLVSGEEPTQPPYGPVPSTEAALVGMWNATDWIGVRTPQYTLNCKRSTLLPNKLYHNEVDPYQMVNHVDNPAYASVKNDLYEQLLVWLDYIEIHKSYLPLVSR